MPKIRAQAWLAQLRASLRGDEAACRCTRVELGCAICAGARADFPRGRLGDDDIEKVEREIPFKSIPLNQRSSTAAAMRTDGSTRMSSTAPGAQGAGGGKEGGARMKTDDLIVALSADAKLTGPTLASRVALGLTLGAIASLVVFMTAVGPRPDIAFAAHTVRFDLKFLDTLAVMAPAVLLCLQQSRPQASVGIVLAWLSIPVAILASAVVVEVATVPSELWAAKIVGKNWWHCLTLVPIFSVPPLTALILALREGAPRHPSLAGALAGLTAAGVSATIYASNCTDDSPLFVATWYPMASAVVVGLGAWIGGRRLAW